MRIDGSYADQNGVSIGRAESTRPERAVSGRRQPPAASASEDRVALSSDAELVASAMKAASEPPAIRQELVDRLRQKLDAGEVGTNVERLADHLIARLLGLEEPVDGV